MTYNLKCSISIDKGNIICNTVILVHTACFFYFGAYITVACVFSFDCKCVQLC